MKKTDDEILVLCNNVKLLRQQNSISKKCFAEIMGISVGALSKIEGGIIPNNVGVEALANLAGHFHIKLHELFATEPHGGINN